MRSRQTRGSVEPLMFYSGKFYCLIEPIKLDCRSFLQGYTVRNEDVVERACHLAFILQAI